MSESPLPTNRLTPSLISEVEAVRFQSEIQFADELAGEALAFKAGETWGVPSSDRVRRRLLASHVRLSPNMAPELFSHCEAAAKALGITKPIELYQAAGDENAANWICADTVFISLQGAMLQQLDREALIALLGHEFGHHLAHTDSFSQSPRQRAILEASGVAFDSTKPRAIRAIASRLAMAKEFTADRFAVLANGSLDGAARLLMSIVTGLPAERLRGDVDAYIAQAKALFEDGEASQFHTIGSHPEHLLRVYALSLFVESDLFMRLIGKEGDGRCISEVDQHLAKLLTAADEHIFEAENDRTLAPEIQEFALCAATLLGSSDGELDEHEAKALEETFSSSVPDWKDLLSRDTALERFNELLPLAIAGGSSVAVSVFQILVHVMLADQQVHIRELETLSSIGRSLRQQALFDYMLSVVTERLRFQIEKSEVELPAPALAPGSNETMAALNSLFAGIARRGGGSVSLSRLLRISGTPDGEAFPLQTVTGIAEAHCLELDEPLRKTEDRTAYLNQLLRFRLTQEEQRRRDAAELAERSGAFGDLQTRDGLLVALKHLRERLISGDGRSPSIRLYRASSGKHFDLAQLDRAVAARSERVATLLNESNTIPILSGDEVAQHKTAAALARSLRDLEREYRARVEETGAHDFFVGYPFLVGKVGPFFVRAPLVLHPFSLKSSSRGSGSFSLCRRDGDPAMANQALIRLIFTKKGFSFTEALAAELDTKAAEGAEVLLTALAQIGLKAEPLSGTVSPFEPMIPQATELLPEGLALSENAVIGFFPQSNSDLLHDYDELLQKLESGGDLEAALNAACDILPAHYRPLFQPVEHATAADQPVVYSDPSQRSAVVAARGTRLLVLDGPPGTGKSQTIVNLAADTLAHGGKVAIICEKRVALDVVKQRLDAAGLGHLAAVVHDIHDDRKALYTHLADRLEATDRRTFDPARYHEAKQEADEIEAMLAARSQLLSTPAPGAGTVARLHTFAANFSTPAIPAPGLEKIEERDLSTLLRVVKELHPYARLFAPQSLFHSANIGGDRRSLADDPPEHLKAIEERLEAAAKTATLYAEQYALHPPIAPEVLEQSESTLQRAIELAQSFCTLPDPELPGRLMALLSEQATQGASAPLEQLLDLVEKHRAAAETEKERVQWEVSEEVKTALPMALRHAGSFFRFLSGDWRQAARILKETLLRYWPEKANEKLTPALIIQIERRVHASVAWNGSVELFRRLRLNSRLPDNAAELYNRLGDILDCRDHASRFAALKPTLATLHLWPLEPDAAQPQGGWGEWIQRVQATLALLAAQRAYYHAVQEASHDFPAINGLAAAQLQELATAFHREAPALGRIDRIAAPLVSQFPAFYQLLEKITALQPEADLAVWNDTVLRSWAEEKLALAETIQPDLRQLDQPIALGSIEKASERLLSLHQTIAGEEALRIAAACDQRGLMSIPPAQPRARRTPEQSTREDLIRECRKKRNVTPMRTLVRRMAKHGLLDVAPIWLMSPETTAILFPREPVFDLLIIDEASQCTVENGLPVLTRTRRAVIAGDDKQMPPTSFFRSGGGLEIEHEEEVEAADTVSADAFEAESLLVLARSGCTHTSLRWHYRSLYEELIAFSNHSMYGGSLLTIPATRSRSATPALQWIGVENGSWEKGSNLVEAKRVVDLLSDLLARPVPPTIGVITFNIQQRRTILNEIDERRAADPEFARLFDTAASQEALDERPFVKNLESVQGDERDAIIFSLGYAPVERIRKDGSRTIVVPARFGPLGQKGGERRLNVAVSRAKKEIIVVSSFEPSMLSVAHTRNDGPRMFKAFVEFARHLGHGKRIAAEKILHLVNNEAQSHRSPKRMVETDADLYLPLHHQIALALETRGHKVETLIGSSEFRLPVAVVTPDDTQSYALAILCDEGNPAAQVYEDYVHIPNVLKHRRWKHLRVTSREWHLQRDQVLQRISDGLLAS